ncbi:MAG TPA: transcription-repair coupling factor [Bacteroidota bacterium]|nr:transcription-repair coupling factor [Bacteroidota bacterium]
MTPLLPHLLDDAPLLERVCRYVSSLEPEQTGSLSGVAGSLTSLLLSALHRSTGRQCLVVTPAREQAIRTADDLSVLASGDQVRLFLGREETGAVLTERSRELNDVHTLRSLATGQTPFVVTHVQGLLYRLPVPQTVRTEALTLDVGSRAGFDATLRTLDKFRFDRMDIVEKPGEYAVRGGIVDVYPYVGENPLRIEFFEDEVESIREFDVVSQRSIRSLASALLVPDVLASDTESAVPEGMLLDYLADGALLVILDPLLHEEPFQRIAASTSAAARYHTRERLNELAALFPRLQISTLAPPDAGLDVGSRSQPAFNGSMQMMARDLAERQAEGYRIILSCDSQSEMNRVRELLLTAGAALEGTPPLDPSRIEYSLEAVHEGFLLSEPRIALYTEHQAFGRIKRQGRRRPRFKGISEKEMQQLRKGDYVVHEDFGIGRFAGLRTIRVRDLEMEVASVLYAENDTLYVNISFINKLQKYSSKDGHIPALHRLGSGEWDRLKARTKKRVKDIARDLIALYAKRKHLEGFTFPADTPWQQELEASFQYEDTYDQAKATVDVKRDMESSSPMDRLICGDVGFGKTEVAIRAAFKAVLAGKQAGVLVPTTILALQHLNTFRDRLDRYGVSVEALSRFKTKKEQEAIIARLREGTLDIVLGTHRLLSKDVSFKHLGLLIIDEEHRFGVTAKEKLRQLRTQVDTLTLTATPIPRTLHFSLLGARDLSIIATAPRNRLPIQTEVLQWNDDSIRDAIQREIQRGGQVYFVHDRIQTMDDIAARLQAILPGVRMRTAHGQMAAHELEEVMLAFLEKRIDILISTKIIESGLDIPNVNTIIINRADHFGMAELYQLRGRVGRSNVQAYAYLLTPPVSVLGKTTLQRLQALQEFTELGSGLNLAMRDLEIRGAGNLLGSEQSGFIEMMGFETYTRLLDEAVHELKREEFRDLFPEEPVRTGTGRDVVVETELEAFIPGTYIAHEAERLTIYRRLYGLTSREQLEEVGNELRDRFGRIPPQVEALFGVMRMKLLAAGLGLPKLHLDTERLEVHFPPQTDAQFYEGEHFQRLMTQISQKRGQGVRLLQTETLLKAIFPFKGNADTALAVSTGIEFLSDLATTAAVPPTAS